MYVIDIDIILKTPTTTNFPLSTNEVHILS